MNWNFRWITDSDYIKSLVFAQWWTEKLETAYNKNIFLHPFMTLSWMDKNKCNPFFCIAQSEKFTVFYPLTIIRKGLLRRLVPAGYNDFDYLEPLFCGKFSPEILESFWNSLNSELKKNEKSWDVIEFRGVRKDFFSEGLTWRKEDTCPGINLRMYSCSKEFIQSRRKAFRNDIERQIKRLSNLGTLEMFDYKDGNLPSDNSINKFLQFRERKWPQTKHKSQLIKTLILKTSKEGIGHFSELRINDIPISWHFGFEYMSVYYCYSLIVNTDFPNYSVGKIHLYFLLCRAYENQMKYFDLMRGAEAYKEDWANSKSELYSHYFVSKTLRTKSRFLIYNIFRKTGFIK